MKKSILPFLMGSFLEHFTILMGVLGQFAPYVQAFNIFYLQSSYAVSLSSFLISFSSIGCWLVYGLSRNIKPLIISSAFGLIGTVLVIIGILYYS